MTRKKCVVFRFKLVPFRGSAAAQCGEALPHRRRTKKEETPPPSVEAQPRRRESRSTLPVSHRLTALCGGKAATSEGSRRGMNSGRPCGLHSRFDDSRIQLLTAVVISFRRFAPSAYFLPSACCLLPPAPCLLSKRNTFASGSTVAISGPFAFAVTNTAAKPASMGRGDVVSWTAFGPHPRNRADRVWRDLVCYRWRTGALRRTAYERHQR